MRIFVAIKSSSSFFLVGLLLSAMLTVMIVAQAKAVGVGIVLCGSQSNITVTEPASDNIVTTSELTIKGLVNQAAQIEVMLDDEFNSVVPLNLGQTTFETIVHISPGTHTIKLKAINACDTGTDDATTIVVTYTAPPDRNADGEAAINPGESGGSAADTSAVESPQGLAGVLAPLSGTTDVILRIFDIREFSSKAPYSQLTVTRAIVLMVGLFIAIFGPSYVRLVTIVASVPIIRGIGKKATIRMGIARWVIRVAGVLIFVGALLI